MHDDMEYTPQDIRAVLAGYEPFTDHWMDGLKPAAVLAPFYPDPENGLSLIFTKRTDHLEQHSGQISFPGGSRDPEDPDSKTTALRETYEEIGVDPEDIRIWGRLNQEATITGFSVAPFVGVIPYPYDFELSRHEVERLIIAPLSHLMNPDYFSWEYYSFKDQQYKSYRYQVGDDVIWGATARMVRNLLALITTGREPDDERPPIRTFFRTAAGK